MKIYLIISIILVEVYSTSMPLNNAQNQWTNFKRTYNKAYGIEEDFKRFQIFEDNLNLIKKHNQKNQELFKLDINQFADLTSEEFRKTLTFTRTNILNFRKFDTNLQDIPESLNWTESGAVTNVKDQGTCGSPAALAIAGVYEGQEYLKTGNLKELSSQELNDCAFGGCIGGILENGYQYVTENGLAAAADYPTDFSWTCRRGSIPSAVTGGGFVEFATIEAELRQVSAQTGPLVVGVDATSWQLYTGGILACNETSYLNHVVLLVGYGSENGSGFWLAKNSWGTGWGDNGYIKVARGQEDANCGITKLITYPLME